MRSSEIFVVGGEPTITYYPRAELKLEDQLLDYLDSGYKILSVSGPTKSGKTVLCRKILPTDSSIWISGGQIVNEDDFWGKVIDELDLYTDNEISATTDKKTGNETGLDLKIIKIAGSKEHTHGMSKKIGRQSTIKNTAISGLIKKRCL